MRRFTQGLLAALLLVSGVQAKDLSHDWKVMAVLQPQFTFTDGKKYDYRWRRMRFNVWGPISRELKAKVQCNFDYRTHALRLLDGYLDYTPLKFPVRVNVIGGMQLPAWAYEGNTFANTVNFAYIIDAFKLWNRTAGGQLNLGFLDHYQVNAGIFTGNPSFSNDSGHPDYVLAFSTAQPWFDARAWWYTGQEGRRGNTRRVDLSGFQIVNARVGRFQGDAEFVGGKKLGLHAMGGYVDAMYHLNSHSEIVGKFDWANLNRDVKGNVRQRYIISYHQRFERWLTTKWDGEYDQKNNALSGLVQADIRF